jgi:hypothetical protein
MKEYSWSRQIVNLLGELVFFLILILIKIEKLLKNEKLY